MPTFNTRIQNKIDTLENYNLVQDSFIPLKGEICLVTVSTQSEDVLTPPQVLMKIGDGTSTWGELNYLAAVSADIIDSLKGSNPTLPADSITGLSEYIQGAIQDTNTRYRLQADGSMGVKLQSSDTGSDPWTDVGSVITFDPTTNITTAIQALDAAAVTAGTGEIISGVSQTDGVVSVQKRSLVANDIPNLTTAKITDFATTVDGRINTKVGNIGDSADVAEFVTGSIDTAMGTLNLNAVTAGTGQVIGTVAQTDGAVTAQLKTLTADDIPAIPTSKVTNLDTTLAGKQDTLVFNTAYNADTNKAATMTDVQNAVAGLSGAMHYIGESTTDPSTGTATVEGHEDWVAGDVVTYQSKEYVYDGEDWRELGDESSFAVKGSIVDADIAANANIAQSKIANLVTDLAAKATPADITSAIQALDKASTAVATGNKITAIEEVDGIINVTTGAIVAGDIPTLPTSKINGLDTTLSGINSDITALESLVGDTAVSTQISTAIENLDVADSAVANSFVTSVSQSDGLISVVRAQPTVANISGLQTALDAKANTDDLATVATTGKIDDLTQTATIIFNCGSSTAVM